VGATLFCLLVGRPPFVEDHLVRLVEKTLSTVPDRVREYRGDIPDELSTLIASCLAKDPGARPQTYEALPSALEPFAAIAEAAPLRLRALAGALDVLVIFVVWIASGTISRFSAHGWSLSQLILADLLVKAGGGILYFGLPEGICGSSLGKYVTGLRVVRDDDSTVSILLGTVRASIHFAAFRLPQVITLLGYFHGTPDGGDLMMAMWTGCIALLLLFFTARSANRLRGIHELADARTNAGHWQPRGGSDVRVPRSREP
jgi:uncharacterized RDD family membrane protein YckC